MPSGAGTFASWIDGSWREGDASFPAVNPSEGKPFAELASATTGDVDTAVASARAAFEKTRSARPSERVKWCRSAAQVLHVCALGPRCRQRFRRRAWVGEYSGLWRKPPSLLAKRESISLKRSIVLTHDNTLQSLETQQPYFCDGRLIVDLVSALEMKSDGSRHAKIPSND